MWNLWFFGDANGKVCPLKNVTCGMLQIKVCRTNCSRASLVINMMLKILIEDKLIESVHDVTTNNSAVLFDHAYLKLIVKLYGPNKLRKTDININTIAKRIHEKKLTTTNNT
jgi:hypothetical protein